MLAGRLHVCFAFWTPTRLLFIAAEKSSCCWGSKILRAVSKRFGDGEVEAMNDAVRYVRYDVRGSFPL